MNDKAYNDTIIIHNGYCLQHYFKLISPGQVSDEIKKSHYTSAERKGNNKVRLNYTCFSCPVCESETPFYAPFMDNTKVDMQADQKEIDEFISPVLPALSEEDMVIRKIDLFPEYKPQSFKGHITCPCCKSVLNAADNYVYTEVKLDGKAIILTCTDILFGFYLDNNFLPDSCCTDPMINETLVFNLATNSVTVKVYGYDNNDVLFARNLEAPADMHCSFIAGLINSNAELRNSVYRCFSSLVSHIPFNAESAAAQDFLLITLFQDYDANFYKNIPFNLNSGRLDKSFKKARNNMHTTQQAEKYFLTFDIPHTKSVRKQVFSNPALLFYKPELEFLYTLSGGNIDEFTKVLSMIISDCYRPLVFMHTHRTENFLTDYCSTTHSKLSYFLKKFMYYQDYAAEYICFYESLTEEARAAERKRWNRRFNFTFRNEILSRPIPADNGSKLHNRRYGRFVFRKVENLMHMRAAGRELFNCMANTDAEMFRNSDIFVVRDTLTGGNAVAAMEIRTGALYQLKGPYNKSEYTFDDELKICIDRFLTDNNCQLIPHETDTARNINLQNNLNFNRHYRHRFNFDELHNEFDDMDLDLLFDNLGL